MKKLAIVLVPLLLMALAALLWVGRAAGRGSDAAPVAPPGIITLAPDQPPTTSELDPDSAQSTAQAANLPSTSDPDLYAEAVAAVVFGLDTTSAGHEDYRAALLAEADPQMSPRGLADLERMVAERIPAPELWERMRANEQWSQWQAESV